MIGNSNLTMLCNIFYLEFSKYHGKEMMLIKGERRLIARNCAILICSLKVTDCDNWLEKVPRKREKKKKKEG